MRSIAVLAAPASEVINDFGYGSEGYWAYKLIEGVSDLGISVIGVTWQQHLFKQIRRARIVSVGKEPYDYGMLDKMRFIKRYFAFSKRILSNMKIDIIHHIIPFGYEAGFNPLAILGYTRGKNFIIGPVPAPHTETPKDETVSYQSSTDIKEHSKTKILLSKIPPLYAPFSRPLLRHLFVKTLREADIILVATNTAQKFYEKYVPRSKIAVLTPGVDTKDFAPSPSKDANEKPRVLLAVGNLTRRKGFSYLIEAMPSILRSHPDCLLKIVGDGPQRHYLEALARKIGVQRNISFEGFIPHYKINKLYSSAHVFCLPALSETWVSILEALASGCPVVTTNVGSAPEFVEDGKEGFITPPRNSAAIAEAVIKILENDGLRLKMRINCREKAKKYDWKRFAESLVSIYQTLAG